MEGEFTIQNTSLKSQIARCTNTAFREAASLTYTAIVLARELYAEGDRLGYEREIRKARCWLAEATQLRDSTDQSRASG